MVHDATSIDADLLNLVRQHQAVITAWNALSWPDRVAEEFLARVNGLEAAIAETPAKSIDGALAKARIVAYRMMVDGSKDDADMATSLVWDLERLAGEA